MLQRIQRPVTGALFFCVPTLSVLAAVYSSGSAIEPSPSVKGATAKLVVTATVAPVATLSVKAKSMTAAATLGSAATFDYANGTKLPDKATLSLGNATFKPGVNVAYVPVTLDHETPNTVIARVITVNGSGTSRAISGTHYRTVDTVVIFRPGDPLRQTVAVPIITAKEGQFFLMKLRESPWGGLQGQSQVTITANDAEAATTAATGTFRAPRTFAATGTLQYKLRKEEMKRSDQGGWDSWATSLSHGRSQVANEETGLYVDSKVYPGIEGPVYYGTKGLTLHTQVLKTPITYQGVSYKYGASVLDGRNFLATQIGYGQYEWYARVPSRRGAWPAFWLVSTSGWPPEIDVYEGFGQQSYWDFDRHIGHTIHGGSGGVRSFQQGVVIQADQAYGLNGFSQDYHFFAVDIQRDYITWFVDGTETYQSVNPFGGFRWYPIMNVAVKTTGAYTDGSGDMIIKSFRVYASP